MANLKEIARGLGIDCADVQIDYLSCNSNDLKPNTLFIAFKGINFDARKIIPNILDQGVVAVIYEDTDDFCAPSLGIPLIGVKDLALKQSVIASIFYNTPSNSLSLFGVTGTNGKSTVTHVIAQWLTALNQPTALLGTLGTGIYPNLQPCQNTTLQALDLEKELDFYRTKNVQNVAMEVSSHGIALKRISELKFKFIGFTNLSRDHLDFHKTMENYAQTKLQLLKMVDSKYCVINYDDEVGQQYYKECPNALVYSTTKIEQPNSIYAENVEFTNSGINFTVKGTYGEAAFSINLMGSFNLENLLCAIGLLLLAGYSLNDLSRTQNAVCPVKGRMECFGNKPKLIVDYAHTPDGLSHAISSLKEHGFKNIICVCGCGGDRDTGKRPIMARIACENAAKVVFTNDNPRTEDPQEIINMMLDGVNDYTNYNVVLDRKEAIMKAIELSTENDAILIAGKGHEDYQIIGKTKIHYSDREVAMELSR